MTDREEILRRLCEPLGSLSKEEQAEAARLGSTDPDVATALSLSREMAALDEERLLSGVPTSDAAFLVTLRRRLEPPTARMFPWRAFGTQRALALSAAACLLVMVAILGVGGRLSFDGAGTSELAASRFAAALESTAPLSLDSLMESVAEPESLAAYLGVADVAAVWSDEALTQGPLTDALLDLDTETLKEVIREIENTEFF